MEEHHEAFLVWHHAIRRQLLSSEGNLLFHVDEHSDLSVPRLRCPIPPAESSEKDLAAFTYAELDIGNFIWPAVYEGIFCELFWMRLWHSAELPPRTMYICAGNDQQTEFITGNVNTLTWEARHVRRVIYQPITTTTAFVAPRPLVLDIDLDYFSSLPYPEYESSRIEVTVEAYREFEQNRYHMLRISPGGKVSSVERDGRYFFVFNDFPVQQPRTPTSVVRKRIVDFFDFVDRCDIEPALIDICRSRRSGYVPKEHADLIESAVLDGLAERFRISTRSIEMIFPNL